MDMKKVKEMCRWVKRLRLYIYIYGCNKSYEIVKRKRSHYLIPILLNLYLKPTSGEYCMAHISEQSIPVLIYPSSHFLPNLTHPSCNYYFLYYLG